MFSPCKLAFFYDFQAILAQPTMLVYHNLDKTLQIDLDALKKFGFKAVLFHIRTNEELPKQTLSFYSTIYSIIFFSRLLTPVQKNYQSTKLEIAGFVWVIKKIRYIVKLSQAKMIIQIDSLFIFNIMQQSYIISTILKIKINIKLV